MKVFAVIGAGQMGAGIAQVAAQAGLEVLLNDVTLERAQGGKAKIE
jgi:3-hydroxybutyryl-CoA dehydrogenase